MYLNFHRITLKIVNTKPTVLNRLKIIKTKLDAKLFSKITLASF